MKEYLEKFKELRKDPKTKPIVSLIMWFVFMVVVVLFVRATSTTKTVEPKTTKETLTTYSFTYTDNITNIFGTSKDNKIEFITNNNRYYYDGTSTYQVVENNVTKIDYDLDILKINPTFIDNLTSNLNYNEIDNYKQYAVPLVNFINLYDYDTEIDLSNLNQYNILINVYENDDNIYMYKIDLTNYYLYKNITNRGILTINIYKDNFYEGVE